MQIIAVEIRTIKSICFVSFLLRLFHFCFYLVLPCDDSSEIIAIPWVIGRNHTRLYTQRGRKWRSRAFKPHEQPQWKNYCVHAKFICREQPNLKCKSVGSNANTRGRATQWPETSWYLRFLSWRGLYSTLAYFECKKQSAEDINLTMCFNRGYVGGACSGRTKSVAELDLQCSFCLLFPGPSLWQFSLQH